MGESPRFWIVFIILFLAYVLAAAMAIVASVPFIAEGLRP